MPPQFLINLDNIDLDNIIYDAEAIEQKNPHRFEMRQIDGIVYLDDTCTDIIAVKNVTDDEFWIRGHIPGRPHHARCLMVEAAAQMSSFAALKRINSDEDLFIGFGGIENVKFRQQVTPGDKLYILGKFIDVRRRRFTMNVQGLVNGKMVFEASIIGMPV